MGLRWKPRMVAQLYSKRICNQSHIDSDLVLPVSAAKLQMVEAIDDKRSIAEIIQRVAAPEPAGLFPREQARSLFERLWWPPEG